MSTLYDEIGGILEEGVAKRDLKARIKVWWNRGYDEVYVNDEHMPRVKRGSSACAWCAS